MENDQIAFKASMTASDIHNLYYIYYTEMYMPVPVSNIGHRITQKINPIPFFPIAYFSEQLKIRRRFDVI